MIQRFLYAAMKQGIDAITADTSLLDDIFEEYELAEAEIESIKTLWASKPPHVKHAYARMDDEFPLYAIVLVNETETETMIGDDGGIVEETDDELHGADIRTSFWSHNYQILTYTGHPDATLYFYEIAKVIILEAAFTTYGVWDLGLAGGDIIPDPAVIPEHLFVRRLDVKMSREFSRTLRASRLGKAFKVRGIHVDKSGSISDPGVQTLVTPYVEGENG